MTPDPALGPTLISSLGRSSNCRSLEFRKMFKGFRQKFKRIYFTQLLRKDQCRRQYGRGYEMVKSKIFLTRWIAMVARFRRILYVLHILFSISAVVSKQASSTSALNQFPDLRLLIRNGICSSKQAVNNRFKESNCQL